MRSATRLREAAAVLALVRRGDRRWHHYASLVEITGSAVAVLLGDYDDGTDSPARLFTEQPDEAELKRIEAEITAWDAEGLHLITVLDSDYPGNLRTVYNRPPFLFAAGALLPQDERSVAVVGTRAATPARIEQTQAITAGLVEARFTVVSGLAAGIDTAAHVAALDAGGRTIAVIGTGLRRSYPRQNEALQAQIAQSSAVVSQFWPDAPPARHHFPMRNAVMSGFAMATVVVEASATSGARMQARLALEHGRPVFLVRSLLEHEWARDYAELPGTYLVDDARAVVEVLDSLHSLDTLVA